MLLHKTIGMTNKSLLAFRREYLAAELKEEHMLEDPFLQFSEWLDDAMRSGISDPTAMSLATADASGRPSVRIVLLKGATSEGLVFLSNYTSRKAKELKKNTRAAALFFWPDLDRQIRIEGEVQKLDDGQSDEYFNARPRQSQIASIISDQSKEIESRQALDDKFSDMLDLIGDEEIKRPAHWGGFILKPETYEFWQGRENRLNDRIEYFNEGKSWKIRRLQP